MGMQSLSKKKCVDAELERKNTARRAKVRKVCLSIYLSMFVVLLITFGIIKFFE